MIKDDRFTIGKQEFTATFDFMGIEIPWSQVGTWVGIDMHIVKIFGPCVQVFLVSEFTIFWLIPTPFQTLRAPLFQAFQSLFVSFEVNPGDVKPSGVFAYVESWMETVLDDSNRAIF